MYIWLLLWIVATVYGIRCVKLQEENLTNGLSYGNIMPLRGIMALEIMFGHFAGHVNDPTPVLINDRIGVLIVGMFFFLSGWGLWESKEHKKNYMESFLNRHFVHIMLPVCILYVVRMIEMWIREQPSVREYIREIAGREIIRYVNWFVWEIIVLYLVFYLLYKYMSHQKANVVLGCMILVFIVVGSYYEIGSRWYGSTLCFLMGLIFSQNKERIFPWIQKRYLSMLAITTILLGTTVLLFVSSGETKRVLSTIAICMSAVFFVLFLVMLLMIIRIGNKCTVFWGKISYEIFVIHATIQSFYKAGIYIENDAIYGGAVIATTILVAWIAYKLKYAFVYRHKKICYN